MNAKEIWHGLSDGHWLSAMLTPANRNRLMKLALAIADQVAFSGSNFVFSVLLGRWMLYETYGAFTYAYSILILLATFHNALLLEPFTVFGSSQYRFTLKTYTDRMARLQWYWGVVISGISLPFGLVLWARAIAVWAKRWSDKDVQARSCISGTCGEVVCCNTPRAVIAPRCTQSYRSSEPHCCTIWAH